MRGREAQSQPVIKGRRGLVAQARALIRFGRDNATRPKGDLGVGPARCRRWGGNRQITVFADLRPAEISRSVGVRKISNHLGPLLTTGFRTAHTPQGEAGARRSGPRPHPIRAGQRDATERRPRSGAGALPTMGWKSPDHRLRRPETRRNQPLCWGKKNFKSLGALAHNGIPNSAHASFSDLIEGDLPTADGRAAPTKPATRSIVAETLEAKRRGPFARAWLIGSRWAR